ncbi:MAG: hypothetical protein WCI73_02555 [Phycisphaerae bacterium]
MGLSPVGTVGTAPRRSASRVWPYRPMVNVGVECRARSMQVLTDAPLRTTFDM